MRSLFACWLGVSLLVTGCSFSAEKPGEPCPDPATQLTREEQIRRTAIDFNQTREDVVKYIGRYYWPVTDSMLLSWEADRSLEGMMIEGEKRYFRHAAPNLFRINDEARRLKEAEEGAEVPGSQRVNRQHVPAVIAELEKSRGLQGRPVRMSVKYTLSVHSNAVPAGEVIRCWLPYPREDNRRQDSIVLLGVNDSNYVLAPVGAMHRTLYLEKSAVKDKPTVFELAFSYRSAPEWFNLTDHRIAPYDTDSKLYRTFTAERSTHVRFTDSIKALSARIVGDEKRPLQVVRRLFEYIDSTYPWASAREYSTVSNIPQYVMENGHGDCGMVSLLFITLARYNGIPAKWQSGFMMHPGATNLHDWAEVYFEGVGWVPVDQSFGCCPFATDEKCRLFFSNGIDAYRWIVNDDYSAPLVPAKKFPRSETVDFQRGEVEWREGNLYFDQWDYRFDVDYLL